MAQINIMTSNFKNITVHHLTGQSSDSNVNDLLATESTNFFGWSCWAGIQNISITNGGEVYRASCKVGGSLGNIFTGFSVPSEPIKCTRRKCTCAADIQLSKAHTEYTHKLRATKHE